MSNIEEIWKDISGLSGLYQVSNYGSVRRITKKPFHVLTKPVTKNGYVLYCLSNKKNIARSAHRLVMMNHNYVDGCESLFVNHKDGNKQNNHISNLEWCTAKENINHAEKTGLRNSKGKGNGNSIISDSDILEIRSLFDSGVKRIVIAKKFGINRSHVRRIGLRINWTHI